MDFGHRLESSKCIVLDAPSRYGLLVLYKQLGVTVIIRLDASTLQDGGVGFGTMLIGFSLDFSALPK